jgi:hypothetical protein
MCKAGGVENELSPTSHLFNVKTGNQKKIHFLKNSAK